MGSTKKRFSELPAGARASMILGGLLQVAFAIWAFIDLARRPREEIRGPKPAWIPVILVNWVGPAAYFVFARKR